MKVGERIRLLRKVKDLKQEDVAQWVDVSGSAVGSWERAQREPSIDMVAKLAMKFGVTADYLIGLTDEPTGASKEKAPVVDLRQFLDQQDVLFNGLPLTDRDKQRVMDILTGLFYDAMRK